MRVTFNIIRDGLAAINAAAEDMAKAQHQVASGRAYRVPSDNPAAVQSTIREYAELGALDSYRRTADAAQSRLAAMDSAMADIVDKLTAAIATAQSARGSEVTPDARQAIADAIGGLRESILSTVNVPYQGSSLFSGTNVDAVAYVNTGAGWTYQGNADTVKVEVARGREVAQTWDGQAVLQGSAAADLFTVFDDLEAAIRAGDAAGMDTGVIELQAAFDRAIRAQGRLGADENGVDDAMARLSDLRIATEARRSKSEDANAVEAITRLNQADVAYRSALGAVSTTGRLTLLDYLK
jgi:flagellar hook-associated protein 3 FlgL